MKKSNSNFNITTGKQQSNPLLEKMFQNADLDTPIIEITQSWDDIDNIYQAVAESIISIAGEINQTIRVINELGMHSNKELEVAMNGLQGDIEMFTRDMVNIRNRHAGMSLVFPIVTTVTEHLADAIDAKRKADAVTDVNVITDVEVKEVTK